MPTTNFDVSSIFTDDVIVNRTGGLTDTTQSSIDNTNNAFLTNSFATFSNSVSGNGLPDDGFFAANSFHPSIDLLYSNTDNGNNARLINTSTGNFTFNVTPAQYTSIHLAVTSASTSDIQVTFNYSDATTTTSGIQTIPDWATTITQSQTKYYLVSGLDISKTDSTGFQNSNNRSLFGFKFVPDLNKTLTSVTVNKTASSGYLVFFGATGVTNTSPTGNVTINGTPTENQTLTATNTLADADGLGTLNYQWQESSDGINFTNISGATNNTFTLGATQVGKQVRVKVSYTDNQGTLETVNSNATNSISAAVNSINVTQATDDGLGTTPGTLSWAIQTANTQAGADIISLQTNVRLNFGDSLFRMVPLIDSDITFNGNGNTINGDNNNNGIVDNQDRPFFFVKSGNVILNNLTLQGGVANPGGGGAGMGGALFIYSGNVTLNQVTLQNNKALGSDNNSAGPGGLRLTGENGSSGANGGNGGNGGFGATGGDGFGDSSKVSDGGHGGDGGFGARGGSGGLGYRAGNGGAGGFGANGGDGGKAKNGSYDGRTGVGGFGSSSLASAGFGGAIFMRSGSLTINAANFLNNIAEGIYHSSGFGGAIFALTQNAIDEHIALNASNQGLPASNELPTINISNNTTFTGNNASSAIDKNQTAIGTDLNTDAVYGTTNAQLAMAMASLQAASLKEDSAAISVASLSALQSATPLFDAGIDYSALALEDLDFALLSDTDEITYKVAFALPTNLDLQTFDPLLAASQGDVNGVKVLAQLATAQILLTQISQALSGALPDQPFTALQTSVAKALDQFITDQVNLGQTVNFGDATQLTTILNSTLSDIQTQNPDLDLQAVTNIKTQLIQVIQASTQSILDAINSGTPQEAIAKISKARQVAFNVGNDLKDVTAGIQTITDVLTKDTGVNLANQITNIIAPVDPTAVNDRFNITEDQLIAGNVFSNNGFGADFDYQGSAFSVVAVNSDNTLVAQNVTLTSGVSIQVNSNGTFNYNPNGKYNSLAQSQTATETFTYQIKNNLSLTDIANVNINITGVNDAPIAKISPNFYQQANTNQAFSYTLPSDIFSDVDNGDAVTITVPNKPTWLNFDPNTGQFTGTTPGTSGTQTITVRGTDNYGGITNQIISIAVTQPVTVTGDSKNVSGASVNETITTNNGNNKVLANDGDDVINGGTGNDSLYGGNGSDRILGNGGNDLISGNNGDDLLYGGTGTDIIIAGDGNDFLYGGDSNDNLTGNTGIDVFALEVFTGSSDTINDFVVGTDKFGLTGGLTFADLSFTTSGTNTLINDINNNLLATVKNVNTTLINNSANFISL